MRSAGSARAPSQPRYGPARPRKRYFSCFSASLEATGATPSLTPEAEAELADDPELQLPLEALLP